MFRRLELIGTLLILFGTTLADSECLIVPFVAIVAGVVMVLIGRRADNGKEDLTE